MQQLFAAGLLGHPDGRHEREAQSNRYAVARATSTSSKTELARERLAAEVRARSPGRSLGSAARDRASDRLGFDLGDVRFHDGPAAALMAHALGARAFAVGREVVLGEDADAPGGPSGARLLEHELVHVAQQELGGAPALQRQEGEAAAAGTTLPSPQSLDNLQLRREVARVQEWLKTHSMALALYQTNQDYLTELQHERGRRILGGHVWMIDSAPPTGQVYQLLPQSPTQVAVAVLEPAKLAAAPQTLGNGVRIMSERQFHGFLEQHSIPTVAQTPVGPMAVAGTGMAVSPWARRSIAPFAESYSGVQDIRTNLLGRVAELSYTTRTASGGFGLFPARDLNQIQWQGKTDQFPVVDWEMLFGELPSVKSSTQGPAGRLRYYWGGTRGKGIPDVTMSGPPARQALLQQASQLIYPNMTPADATARAFENMTLPVNSDDVAAVRGALRGRMTQAPQTFRLAYDLQLRLQNGISVGGQTFTTLQQLDAALQGGTLSQNAYNEALERLATNLADWKIVSSGASTAELEAVTRMRQRFLPGATEAQIEAATTPEWFAAETMGPGRAATGAGLRGAAVGGGVSTVVNIGSQWYEIATDPTGRKEFSVRQLGANLAGGTGSGLVAGSTEQLVTGAMTEGLLPSAVAAGGTAASTSLLARGVGGGASGAIAAPVFVLTVMALDERHYEPHQYVSKGARAAVVGGMSGLGSAVLVGAAFGTAAGPVGIVVGVIVGAMLYYLLDKSVGEMVEENVEDIINPSVAEEQDFGGFMLERMSD
jgi:hypothetical protein